MLCAHSAFCFDLSRREEETLGGCEIITMALLWISEAVNRNHTKTVSLVQVTPCFMLPSTVHLFLELFAKCFC